MRWQDASARSPATTLQDITMAEIDPTPATDPAARAPDAPGA
jgi:hypothetical protein